MAGQPAEADDVYRRELPACSKIVYAVGYSRVPLPQVRIWRWWWWLRCYC